MDVRVITLRYQEGLQGFPEEALRKAISGREVLEAREHFFMHGNMPHMALTLLLGDGPTGGGGGDGGGFRKGQGPDPEETLEESRRPLYRDLKRWRNEQAKSEGKPAYAIARNAQLAEIARRLPHSLAALKEIDGIGEAFCRDYGAKVLGLIPDVLGPASEKAGGGEGEEKAPGGEAAEPPADGGGEKAG
jgi:superfamily II DNA helicase RecQ